LQIGLPESDFQNAIKIEFLPVVREDKNGKEIESTEKDFLIKVSNKQKLKSLLDAYLEMFEADNLKYENFYKYEKSMLMVGKIRQNAYETFGKRITIDVPLDELQYADKQFRTIEVLLSLIKENFVSLSGVLEQTAKDIEKQALDCETFPAVNIAVEFNKSSSINERNYLVK
jgi:hypothetical protein